MGELTFFLGLQINQSAKGIFISKTKYCMELLKKFELENAKVAVTLMATSCYLDQGEQGKMIDQTKYRGMIGSLLYLTVSRPDIIIVCVCVCVCARFQENPKESHLVTVKRIIKYLKGTKTFGLWYPSGASPRLIGYLDSDYGGCNLDNKITSGTRHLLGCSLVSWHSKK